MKAPVMLINVECYRINKWGRFCLWLTGRTLPGTKERQESQELEVLKAEKAKLFTEVCKRAREIAELEEDKDHLKDENAALSKALEAMNKAVGDLEIVYGKQTLDTHLIEAYGKSLKAIESIEKTKGASQ